MKYYSRQDKIREFTSWAIGIFVTLLIIALIFARLSGVMPDYSSGERFGKVIKISKKGIFFKSYEGVLTLSDFAVANTGTPMTFSFSIADEEVAKTVILGENVHLSYNEYLVKPVWVDTGYIVTSCTTQQKEKD